MKTQLEQVRVFNVTSSLTNFECKSIINKSIGTHWIALVMDKYAHDDNVICFDNFCVKNISK